MTKRYGRALSALFCLFLGGMLVWSLVLPDREKSEVENRTLQQLPTLTLDAVLDGSYMDEIETYLADQFPLRDQWTGLKARVEQLIGKREFHGVYLCGDALISEVEPPKDGLADKNLQYVQTLAEKTDIPVYLGLIPSAAEIWKDRLPWGAQSWDQSQLFNAGESLAGIVPVDFHAALSAHADEELFYRTDHHWTTLGAYYGYEALMTALGRGEETLPLEQFSIVGTCETFNGTLYSTSGIHWLEPDEIFFRGTDEGLDITTWRSGSPEAGKLYDWEYLEKKDKYSTFLGGNQPLCVIKNPAVTDGGKLLIVRDSYTDSLAPYLARSFSEVHLLDLRYYRASAAQYAAENGIDAIAVLYSVPNFITDRNLVLLGQ